MLIHPLFDAVMALYAVLGGGLGCYLWTRRMPIEASLRRLDVPDIEPNAIWTLSAGGDVGVV